MDVIQAIQDYVSKMVSNISGLKVLLLDKETTAIVSMVFSQSQILQKDVCLFERIDIQNRELMAHLKAVCFLRPTSENLQLLENELRDPKYGEYHIFFANGIKNSYIEELAEADEHEIVQQLQEFFADYMAVNPDTFTLNVEGVVSPNQKGLIDRAVDGISSCILSLKKQPFIRYAAKSGLADKVVTELKRRITSEPGLYDFRKQDTPPLLLILDRKDDPVTPLLTQWTYQAMVHELFGIHNNRVNLADAKQEIVLSSQQDIWFKQNMYANFGDLCVNVKDLVDDFQKKHKENQNIESLDDIKRFIDNFPEFKKLSGNVTKHVSLMDELSRLVNVRSLMEVSEVEQEIANSDDHGNHLRMIKLLFDNPKISKLDLLRVVLLYQLRYETNANNEITNLMDALDQKGVTKEQLALISTLIQYAGSSARGGADVLGGGFFKKITKGIKRGLKGVQNIYTEHKPYLKMILELTLQNKLKEQQFPFATGNLTREPPQDIIVFIVGGITYEEALTVHELNALNTGCRIILGGTCIHNSTSFLKDVASYTAS